MLLNRMNIAKRGITPTPDVHGFTGRWTATDSLLIYNIQLLPSAFDRYNWRTKKFVFLYVVL